MDLSTNYLGFTLSHPFMPGSSPMADDLGQVRRLEDGGAAAIVLRSLFEEQLLDEERAGREALAATEHVSAEAGSFFYTSSDFTVGPDEYLEKVRKVKAAVHVPVIASLNGVHLERCAGFARQIQNAGADALELNIYWIPTDMDLPGTAVEQTYLDILQTVKGAVKIPVAV
jgi:dihydroorotate dehydrogenase (fumarate)